MLAIGIVVDDAIVVVEAVQHYIDVDKLTPREATERAMKDISGPVVAIALILAAVFVPVGFIPGIVGRLYQQFAITIAISVLISAFVALSLTPALCTMLLRPMHMSESSRGLNFFFYKFNNWFGRVTNRYTRNVDTWIKRSRYVIVLLACICVGVFLLFRSKPSGFIPQEDEGRLYITYELPEASSTTRSIATLNKIMQIIAETKGIRHYAALGGLNAITFATKANSGTIFTSLNPWDERKDKDLQLKGITATLQKKFAAIKEANILVIAPPAIPGLGQTGGFTFEFQQKGSTDDIKTFEKNVNAFVAAVNKRPEIARAFTFFNARTPAYALDVDRDKCKKLGLSLTDVYNTIQTYMGSTYVNDLTVYGRNFRVVAQADSNYRGSISNLNTYYVKNIAGTSGSPECSYIVQSHRECCTYFPLQPFQNS